MTFSNFINKIFIYLKSVRVIKDYISFDLIFSDKWTTPKDCCKDVEIIKNNTEDNKVVFSFVSSKNDEKIDDIEKCVEQIIKYNKEKEEKEVLFRNKVQELKTIFESEKLDDLKSLKFELDEINKILKNGEDREGNRETEERRETVPTEN